MGVTPNLFSASSFDDQKTLPMPDPNNYHIVKSAQVGENLIIMIRYPDCTNYEGEKILVFENCDRETLLKQKTIDPHFSENKQYHSPYARFEPTIRGWRSARMFAQQLRVIKDIKDE